MGKLLRLFVSCMVAALAIFPAAALAASGMQDGLQLSLTTDKGSYAKNETIGINAAVTNTNSFDVTGVKLELIVPTGLQFRTSGATGIMNLTSGQTTDLKSEAVLINNPDDMPQTGDYSPVELLLLLVLLSGGALACLLIIKRKKRVGFLAILLCLTLISSSSFLTPVPAYALPAERSFTVSLPVSVDGEGYNLQAILTYNTPVPTPYAVTVNNGTGDGDYAPGATVTITADDPRDGYAFTGWLVVSGGVTLSSATSTTTTFTMPEGVVEVTATYDLTYAVTVNNGIGNGDYAPGTTVAIMAVTPYAGYTFATWTVVSGGVTLASTTSSTTTFTMPEEAVEVTATYKPIPYAVTVNYGTGDGDYAPGATVTITADDPSPGYAFTGWLVVSGGVTLHSATGATTTFIMPDKAVEVTATYNLIPYAVTVNNGTGDGDYAPGATVAITADAPCTGYAFVGWLVVSGGVTLVSATSTTTTFIMPEGTVEVTATFDLIPYAVTVNNGTGDGDYAPGSTITITADAPSAGYSFTGWTVVSGGVTLASATNATTTFTMPEGAVEVTANYELITYTFLNHDGTGSGKYAPGATVTIAANDSLPEFAFSHWTVLNGGVTLNSPTSKTTTFTMPANDVEVTVTHKRIIFAVTVNSGTGGGKYASGATVTLTADAPSAGYVFTGWAVVWGGVTLASLTDQTTTFTMPSNTVEITANYELIPYAVTVNNGTGGGNYAPGATVTIAATPPAGNRFTGWTVVSGGVTLHSATSETTTFTMPEEAVEVTADYELTTYTVTVKHGYGSGDYAPGDIVTITHSLPSPYNFYYWTVVSGEVTLTNIGSSTTTFTMPANPVEIMARGHTTDNFSPSSNITMTTVLGGLLNQAALVGGTSATALGAPYTLSEDNTSSLAITIAKDSTITYFTATFTTKSAMALIGSTITVYADIYVAPSGTFNYSRVHTLTLSPALTGIVNIDTKCTGESIGLNLSVSEGDKVIILCRSNVIAGLDTAQTLTGSFAAGLTTYIK